MLALAALPVRADETLRCDKPGGATRCGALVAGGILAGAAGQAPLALQMIVQGQRDRFVPPSADATQEGAGTDVAATSDARLTEASPDGVTAEDFPDRPEGPFDERWLQACWQRNLALGLGAECIQSSVVDCVADDRVQTGEEIAACYAPETALWAARYAESLTIARDALGDPEWLKKGEAAWNAWVDELCRPSEAVPWASEECRLTQSAHRALALESWRLE